MTVFAPESGIDIPSIKNQLQQLLELRASGALSEAAYSESKEALERKLLDWVLRDTALDSPVEKSTVPVAPSTPELAALHAGPMLVDERAQGRYSTGPYRVVAGILALAVLAGGGYFWFDRSQGTLVMPLPPSSLSTPLMPKLAAATPAADKSSHSTQAGDIGTLADRLAARLAKQPNDPQGWVMLGRSYNVLGRPAEAVKAYEKAMVMLPDDKALLADYATAVAAAGGSGKGTGTGPMGQAVAPTQSQESTSSSASKLTVSGTVTLAAALGKKVQPTDTVFVVARPPTGSRMPLAALRVQVKDLPLHFTLDDSMGMNPANKLSTAGKVIVSARVSKSGNAIPEKGDLSGETTPVVVGAKGLTIEINQAVK